MRGTILMTIRRTVASVVTAAVLLAGCSSGSHGSGSSKADSIQGVVNRIHCTGYHQHEVVAPTSIDSGYCTEPDGTEADLYLMGSHAAGQGLIDLAKEYGAKSIKWYGNVLVVTSSK